MCPTQMFHPSFHDFTLVCGIQCCLEIKNCIISAFVQLSTVFLNSCALLTCTAVQLSY